MKFKQIISMMLLTYVLAILFTWLIINHTKPTKIDIVAINQHVKTIEANWTDIIQGEHDKLINLPHIAIVNNNDDVIYQSSDKPFTSIYNAIKERESIVNLHVDDQVVGKIIVYHEDSLIVDQMKRQMIFTLIIVFVVLLVISISYTIYLKVKVFTPFNKLQRFASDVARGNLDMPLHMNRNNPFGAFTESFDIMREELAIARSNEYTSNQSKKELVASLSHDIKTPVASIKAITELMLLKTNEEKQYKQLNTIYAKAEQIDLLVTDMFHATLEELQQLKVVVAEESSTILIDMISNVSYDIEIICDPIPPCIIVTDAIRLQQVFDNIISNAYKYAGTDVHIASHLNTTHLVLEIKDFGKGVNEEEQAFLFNKYYRGQNVDGKSGSGLGLFLSRYFMENMLGEIACFTRSDGFTVIVHIKLA